MRMRFFVSVLLVTAVLGWGAASSAHALSVSPVLFDFEITAGERRQATVSLLNDTGHAGTFALEVENFTAFGEEGAQTYLEEGVSTGLASWVTLDRPVVSLAPGESAKFPFLISVPSDAEPGGHYATIFFSEVLDADRGGVGVGGSVGALLLVAVPGDVHEEARIETFTVRGGNWHSRLPVYFDTRIRNLGNTHFRPRGDLVIRNLSGTVVERSSVNPRNAAVLPNSIRRVESAWSQPSFEEGRGTFWQEVQREWEQFAFGPYTATIEVTYGANAWQLTSAETRFWMVPWHLLLILGSAVIALIVLALLYHRWIIRFAVRREKERRFSEK